MRLKTGEKLYRNKVEMVGSSLNVGDTVFLRDAYQTKIIGFDLDARKIDVTFRGMRESVTIDQIGVTNGCDGIFCVNDHVYLPGGKEAIVLGFFKNGDVVIQQAWRIFTVSPSELGLSDGCNDSICSGDFMFRPDGSQVLVSGVYFDGSIRGIHRGNEVQIPSNGLRQLKPNCDLGITKRPGLCY